MGFLVFAAICGALTALIGHSKGRSAIGWFFIGFLLGLIGLIISLCMSNLNEEREFRDHSHREQMRLREQLRQERLKSEAFRRHAAQRLDSHDQHLGVDTRGTGLGLEGPEGAEAIGLEYAPKGHDEPPPYAGAAPANGQQWYFMDAGERKGPVSQRELLKLVEGGDLSPDSPVWSKGMPDWTPIGRIRKLAAAHRRPPASS